MRETRRTLKASNTELRSQIAVHNHVTRASLHDMLRMTRERNEHLVKEIGVLQGANGYLKEKIVEQAAKIAELEKVVA